MTCCSHCQDAEKFFNDKTARRELKRYRKKGPLKSTRLLIESVLKLNVQNKTLLDIGGGIGAIQHALFSHGLAQATHVDASTAYIQISGEEAERLGYHDRLTTYYGDFVELTPELPNADIVTLDRVICCYPDMEKLVNASLNKTGYCCGVVYPREWWFIKAGAWLANLFFRLRNKDFRVFIHSASKIDDVFRQQGFKLHETVKTFGWQVHVYLKI